MSSDPNLDPRDEFEVRPQVSFDVLSDSDSLTLRWSSLTKEWFKLGFAYHDMMAIDETRGVIRFPWDARGDVVDRAASWLASLPGVVNVRRHYGSR